MKSKLKWIVLNIEELVSGIALALMITTICVNVTLRYVFNNSQIFLSEFSLLCMSWATFIGVAAAFKRNQHFGMDFLSNHLPIKYRMILRLIIMFVLMVLFIFLSYIAWRFSLTTTKHTAVAEIPYRWIDMAAALGFTSMSVYSIIYFVQGIFKPEKFALRYASSDSLSESIKDEELMNDEGDK